MSEEQWTLKDAVAAYDEAEKQANAKRSFANERRLFLAAQEVIAIARQVVAAQ